MTILGCSLRMKHVDIRSRRATSTTASIENKGVFSMRTSIQNTARALVAAAILTCVMATTVHAQPGNAGLKYSVAFPAHITVNGQPPAPKFTDVSATASLHNGSRSDIKLQHGGCVHMYTILDESGTSVVQSFPEQCPMIMRFLTIEPGKTVSEAHNVHIEGTKLTDGGKYTLRYSFWGIEKDVPITVSVTQ